MSHNDEHGIFIETVRVQQMQIVLYRAMQKDEDGAPVRDANSRGLGARPGTGPQTDIPVDDEGYVVPETGGLSITPEDWRRLGTRRWLLPRQLGGTGRHPLWGIDSSTLPDGLYYRLDPREPYTHGFIEPVRKMPFEQYQGLLLTSRHLRREVL